jgi:hypothetical protein
MKKILLYVAVALVSVALAGCSAEQGTNPGSDGHPQMTIYQYAPERPLDADEGVRLRLASNGKVTEFYYLFELLSEKEAFLSSNSREAYMARVKTAGIRESVPESGIFEVSKGEMPNRYAISVVAVGSGQEYMTESVYNGVAWVDVVTGTYHFTILSGRSMTPPSKATLLQVDANDPTLYRFKNLFAENYSLKFRTLNLTGSDSQGEYKFCRIPVQDTPFTFTTGGVTYPVSVRDIGYWQGDDGFITEGGYESGLYTTGPVNSMFLLPQWFVAAGSLGYDYDEFVADTE